MRAVRIPPVEDAIADAIVGTGEPVSETRPGEFAIGEADFLLDGEPFQILSGAIHYFRVHPHQWADRIRKARQMGLNTIETYIAWNAHSPRPGEFVTTDGLDLAQFLDLVAAEGMHAIVRPGPYICAEWDNGGLPAWLFRDQNVGIRRDEAVFMAAVADYYERLGPILAPRQVGAGGPIILVQIENEYGAYGDDKNYLGKLVELTRGIGITVPLTTVDQPTDRMIENGSIADAHKTGSFGSRVGERLEVLRRHQPSGPLMCSEFWDGWFDDWGAPHHRTPVAQTAADLDELLASGASVNIYMFHGGTNFGFTNGANDKGTYQPIVTSYDYDAPLDEAGNPTAKYWAFREVIAKYATVEGRPAAITPAAPSFTVPLVRIASVWDVIDRTAEWTRHDGVPTADAIGQYTGFTLYRADIEASAPVVFRVEEVRDRAQVFLNRRRVGVLARDRDDRSILLPVPAGARGVLEVIVEDQGRVNYGPRLTEPKGLIGPATIDGQAFDRWEAAPLLLDDVPALSEAFRHLPEVPEEPPHGPAFARARFDLSRVADLYLDTSAWGKGVVWINGFCLGRYWSRGPQRTLYVPAPLLRGEENELLVLELGSIGSRSAVFVPAADIGFAEP